MTTRRLRMILALAAALVGCSRNGVPPAHAPAGSPADVLFRVSGETVTRGDLDTTVSYLKSYLPQGANEREIVRSAITDDLIPNAAIRAAYKERIPELVARASALRVRIQGGEDFAEVAKAESEDKPSGPKGGDLGLVSRAQLVQPLARIAFTLEDGFVSQPIITRYGVHLLKRVAFEKGRTPLDDQVRVSQILFYFGKGLAGRVEMDKVIADAKVEIVDLAFKDLVPARTLAK